MAYRDKEKQAEAAHWHYVNNRDAMKAKAKYNNQRARKRNREFVKEFLTNNPCVDCGESDPVVLEFDHRDYSRKTVAISTLAGQSVSLDRLRFEMAKCDVRCANCHRRKTYMNKEHLNRR